MRLAAIYIEEHEYLFDQPQTVNLGGEYLYSFKRNNEVIEVSRRKNEQFIVGFFDVNKSVSTVFNVSAIVGQNGTGKTSLMNVIRGRFIEHENALPYAKSLLLFEVKNDEYPQVMPSSSDTIELYIEDEECEENRSIKLSRIDNKNLVQAIYYSPHFDFLYNPNFDDYDKYDLSFDKVLELDLENLSLMDTNKNGWGYSPSQELKFKNTIRQMEFLNSEVIRNNSVFKELFPLPDFGEYDLYFRGYRPEEREWNTPRAYQRGLRLLKNIIDDELKKWNTLGRSGEQFNLEFPEIEIKKYILKREVLQAILSILDYQMERNNQYLSAGKFDFEGYQSFVEQHFDSDGDLDKLVGIFLKFLDYCELGQEFKSDGPIAKAFESGLYKELIDIIYKAIDDVSSKNNIDNDRLITSKYYAERILVKQRSFLHDVYNYFYKLRKNKKGVIISHHDKVVGFVNYMPYRGNMSSGQHALVNLFSRLYSFIQGNLIAPSKTLEPQSNYLILLDEGDLGFHPTWKRKFIMSLCKTLPLFFKTIESKPNIQIIITTHDPLTLSDLPNRNVAYLYRDVYDDKLLVKDSEDEDLPRTFGANIHELLAHSFFLDSTTGEFAESKINEILFFYDRVRKLKQGDSIDNLKGVYIDKREKFYQIKNLIGEDVIRAIIENHLKYLDEEFEIVNASKRLKELDDEIERIKREIEQLKNN